MTEPGGGGTPREAAPSEEPAERGSRRRDVDRSRKRLLDWGVGALCLAVYAVAQVLLLQGPHPFDPARYFKAAVDYPDIPANLWNLRIGLLFPVRLAVLGFGPSEAALYAAPIAFGLLLTASVYATMLVLFRDRLLAAATALATVLNAVFLYRSSLIFPDIAATATFTAGFLFLVLGGRPDPESGPRWKPLLFVAAAGVFFGWTYLIREFSVILIPAVAGAVLILRSGWRRVLILCAAALTAPVLELVYGLAKYGDPLVHIHALLARRHRPVGMGDKPFVQGILGQLNNPLDTLAVFPRDVVTFWSGWFLLALLAPFLVALFVTPDRRLLLFAPWLFVFWMVMALIGLGTLPSGRWILNITNVRYWYPALPALVMGGFGGAALLAARFASARTARLLVPILAAGISLVVFVPGIVNFKACETTGVWRNDPSQRWHELRAWLGSSEAQRYHVLYTDPKSERLLPAFTSAEFGGEVWHGTLMPLEKREPLVPTDHSPDALILVHKDRFLPDIHHAEETFQGLRRDWMPVFQTSDRHMVVLAPRPPGSDPRQDPSGSWSIDIPPIPADPICGQNPYMHLE
jgi:hypothetical protein